MTMLELKYTRIDGSGQSVAGQQYPSRLKHIMPKKCKVQVHLSIHTKGKLTTSCTEVVHKSAGLWTKTKFPSVCFAGNLKHIPDDIS